MPKSSTTYFCAHCSKYKKDANGRRCPIDDCFCKDESRFASKGWKLYRCGSCRRSSSYANPPLPTSNSSQDSLNGGDSHSIPVSTGHKRTLEEIDDSPVPLEEKVHSLPNSDSFNLIPSKRKKLNKYTAHCAACGDCALKDLKRRNHKFCPPGRIIPKQTDLSTLRFYGKLASASGNCKGHSDADGRNERLCNPCSFQLRNQLKALNSVESDEWNPVLEPKSNSLPQDTRNLCSVSSQSLLLSGDDFGMHLSLSQLHSFVELLGVHQCSRPDVQYKGTHLDGEFCEATYQCVTCSEFFRFSNSEKRRILKSKENPLGFLPINVALVYSNLMSGDSFEKYHQRQTSNALGPLQITGDLWYKIEASLEPIIKESPPILE